MAHHLDFEVVVACEHLHLEEAELVIDRVELVDDRPDVRILVEDDLRDQVAMRQVLVAKIKMG